MKAPAILSPRGWTAVLAAVVAIAVLVPLLNLTVPAGSVARNTSIGPSPSRRSPDTCEVRCMTWL